MGVAVSGSLEFLLVQFLSFHVEIVGRIHVCASMLEHACTHTCAGTLHERHCEHMHLLTCQGQALQLTFYTPDSNQIAVTSHSLSMTV